MNMATRSVAEALLQYLVSNGLLNSPASPAQTKFLQITMNNHGELSREELQLLLQIAGELATQTDQDKLVHTILEKACAMTQSPDGSVLLYDPEHQGLYFAAAVGSKGPELMQKWGVQSNQRVCRSKATPARPSPREKSSTSRRPRERKPLQGVERNRQTVEGNRGGAATYW